MSLLLLGCGTTGGAAAPSPFILDTFTDADDTAVSAHTPEVGGAWTAFSGSGTIQQDGFLGDDQIQNAAVPPSANYKVRATFTVTGEPSGQYLRVNGRWTGDTSGTYYYAAYSFGDGVSLWKVVAGSGTPLDSQFVLPTQSLELRMVGDQISYYADDVLQATVTDGSITGAGLCGAENSTSSLSNCILVTRLTATPL